MKKKYSQYADVPSKARAGHGLTYEDLDKIRDDQIHGTVKMIKCNLNPDFELPEHEAEQFFHVITEAPFFDSSTGRRLSTPQRRKYHVRQYKHHVKMGYFNGMQVEVLHDPERYEAGQKEPEDPEKGKDPNIPDVNVDEIK